MNETTKVIANEIINASIEQEMKQSYLDYAMSVIVSRALPDVRDGLKPVHRRVLYAMHQLGNEWNKAYKKSARVVGDVIGKYHPHGDTAVYDSIVRMAQPFSMRYVLVDGQGNFGSVDGDMPAAMRYTEVRMTRLTHALLSDLDKETVDFAPNYDGTEFAPVVLPARFPNLLVNGSSGIAVGMATNIPPHNLNEIINATVAMIDNPAVSIDQLMEYIPGPDFPTAGIISGRAGIIEAYHTGRGRIYVRARTSIEEKGNKTAIIIHELPYQVNKARLLERIAELVKEKSIEGISGLRDESDKDGMRVVIELRRGESPDVVLNNLYIHTPMQHVFGINMVALDDGQPSLLNLKQILAAFIAHRREVVTRRTVFNLNKARARAHILEGLSVALANIDEVITLIKQASSPAQAKQQLMERAWKSDQVKLLHKLLAKDAVTHNQDVYHLSELQAQAILDLRLHRLTALEQDKIGEEYKQLIDLIIDLTKILEDNAYLMSIIKQELIEIKDQFGDERRTEIISSHEELTNEDLIPREELVVTLSHQGYAKTQAVAEYKAQRRGGRGKMATDVKEEDFIEKLLVANTHDTLLCFSNFGKAYWLKTYQLPRAERQARGKPMVNLLPLEAGEAINAILPVKEFDQERFIFMVTAHATVKKMPLHFFERPRSTGLIAVSLDEGDQLVAAAITNGKQDVLLFSSEGNAIRFSEEDVRAMGRTACGVRGMRLKEQQKIVSLIVVNSDADVILVATENGYGKRTSVDEFRTIGRGGQGVIAIKTGERNGNVIGAVRAEETDEIMLISNRGTLVRTRIKEISVLGRNTQGVRLINLSEDEKLIGVETVSEVAGVEEEIVKSEE